MQTGRLFEPPYLTPGPSPPKRRRGELILLARATQGGARSSLTLGYCLKPLTGFLRWRLDSRKVDGQEVTKVADCNALGVTWSFWVGFASDTLML